MATTGANNKEIADNIIDWNELFTHDVIAVKMGKQAGGLGRWLYSDPKTVNDPVKGSSLWTKFLKEHPEYYIYNAEVNLAKEAATKVADIVDEPVVLGYLGVGDTASFEQKDLIVTGLFQSVINLHVIDISTQYSNDALKILEEKRPNITKSATVKDAFDGFNISLEGATEAKRVVTMFGGTFLNVAIERDKNLRILRPEKQIRANIKSIRKSLSKGDFFIATHDGNTDPKKIEHAYAGLANMFCNFAHRIKRDTTYTNIDTEKTIFRQEFDTNSKVLLMYLTLDFKDNGGPKEYLIQSSPKVEKDTFLQWAKTDGFTARHSIEENGVHLHLLEAT